MPAVAEQHDRAQCRQPRRLQLARLRLAVNTRRRNASTGEWEEKPNYFDVTVWGAQAENCDKYLAKGRPVAVDGRLEWREFEARDGGKRQAVEIIAETVQFLGPAADQQPSAQVVPCDPQARTAELEDRAYILETASPGTTMTMQGPELAIARLNPQFVTRLASAIRDARQG